MNKKKIVVPIIIGIVLVVALLLGKNISQITGNITMVYDTTIGDVNKFNRFLLNMYSQDKDITNNVVVADGDSYLDYVVNGITENKNEDIYYTNYSSQVFSRLNGLYDIYPFEKNISKELPASFYSLSKKDKSYIYVPITWSPWGIYYNKEIFNELGLSEPKTLTELDKISEKLLEEGITPYSMIQKIKWPLTTWFDYLDIRTNGAEFHNNLLNGKVSFTDDKVIAIYTRLYKMIADGYFNIDKTEFEWKSMLDTISEKKTAMVLGGAFFYDNASEELKDNLGWFPFPLNSIGDEYDEIVTTSGYVARYNIKNIRAVKDYIKYSLSYSAQQTIVNYSNFYPVNNSVLEKLNREDLNKAYSNISNANNLTASFERNCSSEFHIPIKWSINSLFSVKSDEDILGILKEVNKVQ